MLKTRPRVLLGVIFSTVNIVGLSDQSSHPALIDCEVTVGHYHHLYHHLPLPNISQLTRQGRNLSTAATTYLCPLAPVFINHHHTAFPVNQQDRGENLLVFKRNISLIVKLTGCFFLGRNLLISS